MPHSTQENPAHAGSHGLRRLRRRRALAGSVLAIVAVYLIAGGVAFHTMMEMEQQGAAYFTPAQMEQFKMPGVDNRLFTVNWWFQESILVPLLVAVGAFWIWFKAGRRLVPWEPSCPQCRSRFPEIACPECGLKSRSSAPALLNDDAEDRLEDVDRSTEEHASDLDLRFIRFGGALILFLSSLHLIVGGVFIHVMPLILPHLMGPGGATLQNAEIYGQARQWDVHFRWGVLPAVLAAGFGFAIWFLTDRRLARASGSCPACRYDLSGIRCPSCGSSRSGETTAEFII